VSPGPRLSFCRQVRRLRGRGQRGTPCTPAGRRARAAWRRLRPAARVANLQAAGLGASGAPARRGW